MSIERLVIFEIHAEAEERMEGETKSEQLIFPVLHTQTCKPSTAVEELCKHISN